VKTAEGRGSSNTLHSGKAEEESRKESRISQPEGIDLPGSFVRNSKSERNDRRINIVKREEQ
jgi:hypothetical protein